MAHSLRRLRVHDVTLFIIEDDRIAVIRKPMFPPGAFRAPSGGVAPGETMEEGALREGMEETGLRLELLRYVLRVTATFCPRTVPKGGLGLPPEVADPSDPSAFRWWIHVLLARPCGDTTLAPVDTHEIAEARWVGLDDLQGAIRENLLATGWALFGYRVALTDAVLADLGFA